jgi:hypothetical protein
LFEKRLYFDEEEEETRYGSTDEIHDDLTSLRFKGSQRYLSNPLVCSFI